MNSNMQFAFLLLLLLHSLVNSSSYRGYSMEQVAKVIDHSVLHPRTTFEEVQAGAEVALKYRCASYCIRPIDVAQAAKYLQGSNVKICTVIGFPHGTCTTATKVFEAIEAVENGARELDMVMNVAAMLSGDYETVESDISAVVNAVKKHSPHNEATTVKVIFETCLLSDELIVRACEIASRAGAQYVKTSTGFGSAGATQHHVNLMVSTVRNVDSKMKVKSSGGVKTLDQLIDYMDAGVSRSGCSATHDVMQEFIHKIHDLEP